MSSAVFVTEEPPADQAGKKPDGGPRVTFPSEPEANNASGSQAVRQTSSFWRPPSTHNTSFSPTGFPHDSFINNTSGDQMNPLSLLKMSFVAPVSDEQALRNDLLMRLGQDPVFANDTFVMLPSASFVAPPAFFGTPGPHVAGTPLPTSFSPQEPRQQPSQHTLPSADHDEHDAFLDCARQLEQEPYVYRTAIRVPEAEGRPQLDYPSQLAFPDSGAAAAAESDPATARRRTEDVAGVNKASEGDSAEKESPRSSEESGEGPLFSAEEWGEPSHEPVAGAASPAGGQPPEEPNVYLSTGCFRAEPLSGADILRERILIDQFNGLSAPIRRMEVLEAFYGAHMAPYETNASFTADNWDDMSAEKVTTCFELTFDQVRYCFHLTLFRRRFRIFLFSYLLRCFCIFLFWVIMFCLIPKNWFYPGGLYFDTFTTILFAGICGTIAAKLLSVPSIVGVIWMGLLWANVPYTGRLTKGINADIRAFIGMFGLSVGLVRAGLSLSVIRFKQKFKHYFAFSLTPMAVEMVVHGVCCKAIYGYDSYKYAFAEGFLVSSIAPSVVVPIIIQYQKRGYGVRDGPSMMMLCSIAFDTASCVWGIQFLLALEFKKMNTALLIVLAPVQIVVGVVGGIVLGVLVFCVTFFILISESERLPLIREARPMTLRHSVHVRYMSIGFMVLIAFTEIAVGRRFNCLGGAAVAVVFSAGTFNYLCVRGGTRDHLRVKADMAQSLTTVWDYIAMPSLFGLAGAAVNTHELFARDFIGLAFALVFISIGTRCLTAMIVPHLTRLGLSWRETIFCGVGWIGKGSVQGALGSTALMYAQQMLAVATTAEDVAYANRKIQDGIKMKNTAILSVLVACPICSIFLTNLTGKLLTPGT